MAALVARDYIEALREKIDNLALALITPLRTKNDYITHFFEGRPGDYCSSGTIRPRSNRLVV
jgi:hypothetical protein